MPKINIEEIIQKEPYKSIINMLKFFDKGLEPKHFRYELGKKYTDKKVNITYHAELKVSEKGIKTPIAIEIEKELKEKRKLYEKSILRNNEYIRYSKQLTEKLNFLVEKKLLKFSKDGRYTLSEHCLGLGSKIQMLHNIESYSNDQILPFGYASTSNTNINVLGISRNIDILISKKDIPDVFDALDIIQEKYDFINSLKWKKLMEIWIVKLRKFEKKANNKKIKRIIQKEINIIERQKIQTSSITLTEINENFLFALIYVCLPQHYGLKVSKTNFLQIANNLYDYFNDQDEIVQSALNELKNLSNTEYQEILDFGCNNFNFFIKDVFPLDIMISCYSKQTFRNSLETLIPQRFKIDKNKYPK